MRRIRCSAAAGLAVAALALTGCGQPHEGPGAPAVATFRVIDQTYRIELVTPELVRHAQDLLNGEEVAGIPVGAIVRGDPAINEPWSWHIDPQTVEFADFTTEVCDGLPEYVEDGTLTSDIYCPWSAEIVSLEPVG